ncbi:MAG TPA: hypothetical protein VF039_09740 [Longimicrobiales bacterium]
MRILLLISGIAAFLPVGSLGQQLTTDPCDCRIELRRITTIGAVGESLYGSPVSFDRAANGSFILVMPPIEPTPLVANPDGTLRGPLGREGAGPGEYRAPMHVFVDEADTIWISDPRNARVSVLTPELGFSRSMPIPPTTEALVRTTSGAIIIHGRMFTPDGVGFPLHRLDSAGLYSFGRENPVVAPHLEHLEIRRVARSRDGSVWSVPFVGHYLLERWRPDGTRLSAMERAVAWFPESRNSWEHLAGRPPTPRISGIWEDADAKVWVAILIADENWERGVGETRSAEGRRYYTVADRDDLFDTVIEVIDPVRSAVISSVRFDRAISLVAPSGLLGDVILAEDDTYRLEVFQPILSLQ